MSQTSSPSAPLMLSVSGLRGVVGSSLTPAVAARFVGVLARHFREAADTDRPTVALAADGRQGCAPLRHLAAGALAAAGCRVRDLGVAMTPTVGHTVLAHKLDGGLVLTASHNPAEWNGLKPITRLGGAPAPELARTLVDRYHSADEPAWADFAAVGDVETDPDATARHAADALARLAELSPGSADRARARRFTIVADSVNASGAPGLRLLLDALGCELIHLHDAPTGVFPHTPEPIEQNLTELAAAVRERGADIGLAQDPDGDRLAIVDETGRFIGEEYTLALCARAFLGALPDAERSRQVLAANLSTSRMIDDIAATFGATVRRTPVGEANVVAAMRDAGSRLGGEGNGGVVWNDVVPVRDSLSSAALVLDLLARSNEPLSAIVDALPRYAIEKRKQPASPDLIANLAPALAGLFPAARTDDQDGVRLDFPAPDGGGEAWLHARPSNTEPIVRLIAEAPTPAAAADILDRAERALAR